MVQLPSFESKVVKSFAEIEQEFLERVNRMVWCSAATVDLNNNPRSRILHPLWEGSTGWITTYNNSPKSKHLAHNPRMALTYAGDVRQPVNIDCIAEWLTDSAEKERVWNLFKATPEPLGFDPGMMWDGWNDPVFGILKLTPTRIEVFTLAVGTRVWYASKQAVATPN
jgi:general stress protein 26